MKRYSAYVHNYLYSQYYLYLFSHVISTTADTLDAHEDKYTRPPLTVGTILYLRFQRKIGAFLSN